MKPILFNTEMVSAILEGRKTVTRRCIKKVPNDFIFGGWKTNSGNDISYGECMFYKGEKRIYVKPKYLTGDILYVRETWFYENHMEDLTEGEPDLSNGRYSSRYLFKASSPSYLVDIGVGGTGWKPSMHMPKEVARIFLRVKDVRIERLSNMLGCDCVKEGIKIFTKDGVLKKYAVSENWWNEFHSKHKSFKGTSWQDMPTSIFEAFSYLWNSTIDKKELDIYGWNANPFVFVYEFEVISKDEAYAEELK